MSDAESSPCRITGRKFLEALRDAGVIRQGDFVRRVVIDAELDCVLRVHVERIGDDRTLKVEPTLAGVEVEAVAVDAAVGESPVEGRTFTLGSGDLERLFRDWFHKALRSGELRLD